MNRLLTLRLKVKIAFVAGIAAFVVGGAGAVLAANVTPRPHPSPHATPSAQVSPSPHSTISPNSTATPHPSATPQSGDSSDSFGSQVAAQVAKCKAARPASGGHRGIGRCVSAWVKAHHPADTGDQDSTSEPEEPSGD
jgi:hypothetical protein